MTTPRPAGGPLPAHVPVLVVGSGFGGIATSYRLAQAGIEHLVVERADEVGGTWRDNHYPGCACDVPSNLYSLSFAPNPRWTRTFSPQEEIQAYLRDVSERTGVAGRTAFGTSMLSARWDDVEGVWRVTTDRGDLTAHVLVAATGGLSSPTTPDVPGLDGFPGTVVHTAAWDDAIDLDGRRVAVVGTGASAIQVVPGIVDRVAALTLFQRTPAWVMPRRDRSTTAFERSLFRHVPQAQRAVRLQQYLVREIGTLAMTRHVPWLARARAEALAHLAAQVADPGLRATLTPTYTLGCKRILLSNDFYPALCQPHVAVVPAALVAVEGSRLVAADGSGHDVDTIVLATGFEVTEPPVAHAVHGHDGRSLAQTWRGSPRAYKGVTMPGFPNLFVLTGPNTGLGTNSMVYMIESQVSYVVDAVRTMRARGFRSVEVTPESQERWNDALDARLAGTVWATGSCASWYQDRTGRVAALWPDLTWRFRRATRRFDAGAYACVPAAATSSSSDSSMPLPSTSTSVTRS